MMQRGEYKLAIQRSLTGYYAGVSLSAAVLVTDWGVVVQYDVQDSRTRRWQRAIEFGVEYVYDLLPPRAGRGLHVVIHEVDYNPVDTNSLTMTFATMCALFKALDWTPANPPTFDPDRGLLLPTEFTAEFMLPG